MHFIWSLDSLIYESRHVWILKYLAMLHCTRYRTFTVTNFTEHNPQAVKGKDLYCTRFRIFTAPLTLLSRIPCGKRKRTVLFKVQSLYYSCNFTEQDTPSNEGKRPVLYKVQNLYYNYNFTEHDPPAVKRRDLYCTKYRIFTVTVTLLSRIPQQWRKETSTVQGSESLL